MGGLEWLALGAGLGDVWLGIRFYFRPRRDAGGDRMTSARVSRRDLGGFLGEVLGGDLGGNLGGSLSAKIADSRTERLFFRCDFVRSVNTKRIRRENKT